MKLKSNPDDLVLLDAYLQGILNSDQKTALERRLEVDPALYSDLATLRLWRDGMRTNDLAHRWEDMKSWEADLHRQKPKLYWKKWTMAIIFIVFVGYLFYMLTLKTKQTIPTAYKQLFAEVFDQKLILHSTKRSVVQPRDLSSEQRRAYEMYSVQLFEEAIPLLDDLWREKQDTLALFYLGVSYMGVGEQKKGFEIFDKVELKKYSSQSQLFNNQ